MRRHGLHRHRGQRHVRHDELRHRQRRVPDGVQRGYGDAAIHRQGHRRPHRAGGGHRRRVRRSGGRGAGAARDGGSHQGHGARHDRSPDLHAGGRRPEHQHLRHGDGAGRFLHAADHPAGRKQQLHRGDAAGAEDRPRQHPVLRHERRQQFFVLLPVVPVRQRRRGYGQQLPAEGCCHGGKDRQSEHHQPGSAAPLRHRYRRHRRGQ